MSHLGYNYWATISNNGRVIAEKGFYDRSAIDIWKSDYPDHYTLETELLL